MANPVVFRYLSYSTTLAEYGFHWFIAVPGLRPAWDMFVLVCSVNLLLSDPPTGWPHDHGPTNVGAMVKITLVTFRMSTNVQT